MWGLMLRSTSQSQIMGDNAGVQQAYRCSFDFLLANVLCGWLLHCKTFLTFIAAVSQHSRLSGLFMW